MAIYNQAPKTLYLKNVTQGLFSQSTNHLECSTYLNQAVIINWQCKEESKCSTHFYISPAD